MKKDERNKAFALRSIELCEQLIEDAENHLKWFNDIKEGKTEYNKPLSHMEFIKPYSLFMEFIGETNHEISQRGMIGTHVTMLKDNLNILKSITKQFDTNAIIELFEKLEERKKTFRKDQTSQKLTKPEIGRSNPVKGDKIQKQG